MHENLGEEGGIRPLRGSENGLPNETVALRFAPTVLGMSLLARKYEPLFTRGKGMIFPAMCDLTASRITR